MVVSEHQSLSMPIEDASQVGEARRTVVALAESLGFDQTRRGAAAVIVTELANNLMRHAKGGELLVRAPGSSAEPASGECNPECVALELLAVDRGPGMASVGAALRDGFSTGGTPGNGLGAVRRMSDEFDFYSAIGVGTVIMSRLRARAPQRSLAEVLDGRAPAEMAAGEADGALRAGGFDVAAVCLPKPGESVCGDGWWIASNAGMAGRTVVLLADGLGHGLGAADASWLAVRLLRENAGLELARLMELLHTALRSGRGAAVALLEMRRGSDEMQFAGVGNISAVIVDVRGGGTTRSLMSHNGTVGAEMRRLQQLTYRLPAGALLVMHSDGLSAQWQLGKYSGLAARRAGVIAGVLYRDHRRIRDDATVLVIRRGGSA